MLSLIVVDCVMLAIPPTTLSVTATRLNDTTVERERQQKRCSRQSLAHCLLLQPRRH